MQFVMALQDDRFAEAFYSVFANRTFFSEAGSRLTVGQEEIAWYIIELRGLGEDPEKFSSLPRISDVWPDDRPAVEAHLRAEEEWIEWSGKLGWTNDEMSTVHRDLYQKRVSYFDDPENRAMVEAVVDYVKRYGWRPEIEEDRNRQRQADLKRRVSILREITTLEACPERAAPEWALAYTKCHYSTYVFGNTADLAALSEEEREAYSPGALRKRLLALAKSGRIPKQDFERLRAELFGHEAHMRTVVLAKP